MIVQDGELAIHAGRIVAAGCGYLNEEHFVAVAVSNIAPFDVPPLKLENQYKAWAIAWRIVSAWFWCGSAIFLTIQLAILISAQPEMHDRAEELVNVVGAFWSWLVTFPCLAFAGVALIFSFRVSAPVLIVNLILFGWLVWQVAKWILIICTIGFLWAMLDKWFDKRR